MQDLPFRWFPAERLAPALLAVASVGATVTACQSKASVNGAGSTLASASAAPLGDLEVIRGVPVYGAPAGPPRPPGKATVSGLQAKGGKVADAAYVVEHMSTGFGQCYRRGLSQDPAIRGTLRVELDIAANGWVSSSTATELAPVKATESSPNLEPLIGPCVEARAGAGQFAPPTGQPSAQLSFDVRFEPLPQTKD